MGNRRGNYGVHEMIETIFVLWCFTCDAPTAVAQFYKLETCEVAKAKAVKHSGWGADYKCIPTERRK
jgi:hypothetical protein